MPTRRQKAAVEHLAIKEQPTAGIQADQGELAKSLQPRKTRTYLSQGNTQVLYTQHP